MAERSGQSTHPCDTLITGAAGFIGSHLAERLLANGQRVVGLDNFNDFYDPQIKRASAGALNTHDRFEMVDADIRDRALVMQALAAHRPKTIVHLAAMAGVRPSIENPALYTAVNLDGTVNLLDAAIASDCERFVFASSSSVYGNNEKVPFAEEDRVDHPISPYAATKKAGELICHTYAHLHDLPMTCLRFFTVFGPRQRPDLAIHKFLRLVSEENPIPMFGDGSTSRDYTYVDDIVDGIVGAIDTCGQIERFRIYNLGGSSPVSLREMIDTVGRVTGKPAKIDHKPMQPGDVDRTYADVSRAKAELGYEPRVSLEEGIARQWAWMQGKSG